MNLLNYRLTFLGRLLAFLVKFEGNDGCDDCKDCTNENNSTDDRQ